MNYNIITIEQVKDWLNMSGAGHDQFLNALVAVVSRQIEEYVGKPLITRQFTEYYDGDGSDTLRVKRYPIYKVVTLHDSTDYSYGSADLIAADDRYIESEEGFIGLYNDERYFTRWNRNIKLVYHAGYSRFTIVEDVNDRLDINEGSGAVAVQITAGEYDAADLATQLATDLNANGSLSRTYTVTYDYQRLQFRIGADSSVSILWNTGANLYRSIGQTIGFSVFSDDASGTLFTSDSPTTGLPDDFNLAAQRLAGFYYELSKKGAGRAGIESEENNSGGTIQFRREKMPDDVIELLSPYKRIFL